MPGPVKLLGAPNRPAALRSALPRSRRRDNLIGTGPPQLGRRRLAGGACNHPEIGTQTLGREHDERVCGVVVHTGDEPSGAVDAGRPQAPSSSSPLPSTNARPSNDARSSAGAPESTTRTRGPARPVHWRDATAHATAATDDVMPVQTGNSRLHAPPLPGSRNHAAHDSSIVKPTTYRKIETPLINTSSVTSRPQVCLGGLTSPAVVIVFTDR
jgi:hypothetical protein